MPARKPQELHTRHATKADKAARAKSEAALRPGHGLPKDPPAQLDGHDVARAAWRRLMRVYAELEAEVVTRLDMDLLVDYCLLSEQVVEMDKIAAIARAAVAKNDDDETWGTLQSIDLVVKLDARVDRKRALLLQLRQSLYLTPRARAGVAPAAKAPPEETDPLEELLAGVDLDPHEPGRK